MEHLAPLSTWQSLTLLAATVIAVYGFVSYFARRAGRRRRAPRIDPLPVPEATSTPLQKMAASQGQSAPQAMLDRSTDQAPGKARPVASAPPQPGFGEALEPKRVPDAGDAAAECARLLAAANSRLQATPAMTVEAAAGFRDVVRLAAAKGFTDVHATARLELGELARLEGDLITACEHWQIARGLFNEMKNKPRANAVELRMREHGCPTDWVLNDF